MRRLYAWINSDARDKPLTIRAHQTLSVQINYGSKDHSDELIKICIEWKKEDKTPKIYIRQTEEITELNSDKCR